MKRITPGLPATCAALALGASLVARPLAAQSADEGSFPSPKPPPEWQTPGPAPAPAPAPQPGPKPTPPPLPPSSDLSVYVALNGQATGPHDGPTLQQMARSGQLTRSTLVWMEGMANWAEAGTLPELKALFGATPAPQPQPTPGPADPAAYLLGDWQADPGTIPMPDGELVVEQGSMQLRPDGTMSIRLAGTANVRADGKASGIGVEITLEGPFSASGDTQQGILLESTAPVTYTFSPPRWRRSAAFRRQVGADKIQYHRSEHHA